MCRGTTTSAIWNVVATVADDFSADLDQLLAQAGQRPRFSRLRHREGSHEIAEIVGKGMELKADGLGGEGTARQPRPLDRALALFDVLLAGPIGAYQSERSPLRSKNCTSCAGASRSDACRSATPTRLKVRAPTQRHCRLVG
jgi:hypothetical protein